MIHPSSAAATLSVSLGRYYQLERRALESFLQGCEPAPKGRRQAGPQKQIEGLEKQVRRLERDLARYQALARASQRTAGLPAVKTAPKGKRKRRPTVRALKIARGPKLVEELDGSRAARQRLRVILETITGEKSVPEACKELGISEAMFHKLRNRFLQEAVSLLEPRPPGRKRQEPDAAKEQLVELERKVEKLGAELEAARIQTELALLMPQVLEARVLKKKKARRKKKRRR